MALEGFYILDNLPKPFTCKENDYYFQLLFSGSLEAREKLIEHNLYIIARVIKNKYLHYTDKEYLFSIGIDGLIKSIDEYRFELKNPFKSMAYKNIEREIAKYLKGEKKEEAVKERVKERFTDNNPDFRLTLENNEVLYEEISKLSPKGQYIFKHYYGLQGCNRLTIYELGDKLGLTYQEISRYVIDTLDKMQKNILFLEHMAGLEDLREIFGNYSKRQLMLAIDRLDLKVKVFLCLKYGSKLDDLSLVKWKSNNNKYLYSYIIPRIRWLLMHEYYISLRPNNDLKISNDYYNELIAGLKNSDLMDLMGDLSLTEFVVISSKLGLVNEREHTTTSVAKYVGITEKEVIAITRDFLMAKREEILSNKPKDKKLN